MSCCPWRRLGVALGLIHCIKCVVSAMVRQCSYIARYVWTVSFALHGPLHAAFRQDSASLWKWFEYRRSVGSDEMNDKVKQVVHRRLFWRRNCTSEHHYQRDYSIVKWHQNLLHIFSVYFQTLRRHEVGALYIAAQRPRTVERMM